MDVQAEGFKRTVRDGISLGVNQAALVDLPLELGGTVDRERVVNMPLNGRNMYSLVSILPGVSRTTALTVADNWLRTPMRCRNSPCSRATLTPSLDAASAA